LTFFRLSLARDRRTVGQCFRSAFEVKSLRGDYQRIERQMQPGDDFSLRVQSAAEILAAAASQISQAVDQLSRKLPTDHDYCKSIFLLIHPFDGIAAEIFDDAPVIGHLLPLWIRASIWTNSGCIGTPDYRRGGLSVTGDGLTC
jgi:hypothetical protein